jgi:type IV pilus assembly protein PilY1
MKKEQLTTLAKRALCCALSWSMVYAGAVSAQVTDIAQEPLGQPASNTPPNVMVLYDDSLSMRNQVTPDYVGRYFDSDNNRLCFDSKDSSSNITGGLVNCQQGDVPVMSPDINTQYYNPTIRYLPALNYDASERISMTCANTGGTTATTTVGADSYTYCTGGWTATPTDNVSTVSTFRNPASSMVEQGEITGSQTTDDLTQFPDRVWCTAQGDSSSSATLCRQNSGWDYPNQNFGYGWSSGPSGSGRSNVKRRSGAPYYYRLATNEYCNNAELASTSSDSPARCIAATAASGTYTFPAPVRYCTDSTLTNCQGKYNSTYSYPKYAGNTSNTSITEVRATGRITVTNPQSDTQAGMISQINVNGVNIISCGAISLAAGFTPNAAANAIRDQINACNTTPEYTATASSNVVTVTAAAGSGALPNGFPINVVFAAAATTPATMTFTFSNTSDATGTSTSNSSQVSVAQLANLPGSPSTFNLISSTVSCTTTSSPDCDPNTQSTRNENMARRFYDNMTLPSGWSKSINNAVITLTSPASPGYNGVTLTRTTNRTTLTPTTSSGSVTFNDIEVTTAPFSGGIEGVGPPVRQNVGQFSRVDIRSDRYCTDFTRTVCVAQTQPSASHPIAEDTFSKASGRSDCTGTVCSYEEEMTNFANWFSYYRSRGQMAKTAVGRAFASIGAQFRVGLVTIQPLASGSASSTTTAVSSNRYLKIDAFSGTHKEDWFTKLYGITDNAGTGTPNRSGLARVGRYYADKRPNSMDASPVIYSCQSNYTLLVTDGYWNGGGGLDLAGNAIANEDANLLTMPRPMYDGTQSTITETFTTTTVLNTGAAFGSTSACTTGRQRQRQTVVTTTRTHVFNGTDTSGSPISTTDTTDSPGTTTTLVGCTVTASLPALPTPNPAVSGILTTNTAVAGGSTGSLADVAAYYYNNDLLPAMPNEVPAVASDTAAHQHMTTFSVGLGLAGTLNYEAGYLIQKTGDYVNLKQGAKNWPVPSADSESALDDTWHAAVNGRGQFFSVKDPNELAQSLTDTLSAVTSREGAGAAAATSNLQPVAGDNFAFTAQYQTVIWTGDLTARTIDLTDGIVSSRTLWSAATQLDQRTSQNRNIITFDSADTSATFPANGNRVKSFCWSGIDTVDYPNCVDGSGLTSAELELFEPVATLTLPVGPPLTQSLSWAVDGSGRDTAATKEKLVDYLRGDRSNEITGESPVPPSDLFRARQSLLGDIVSAQPAYVKAAPFKYSDAFYTDYQKDTDGTNGTRKGTVFAAANDGMLHAFETDPDNKPYFQIEGIATSAEGDDKFSNLNDPAGTISTNAVTGEGAERWAFIPSMVLPTLKRLADAPYSHVYSTDGSPAIGDVCFGHTAAVPCAAKANWRTILVGGLNAGGRGYYALDITDPDNPKGLWELKGGTGQTCLTDAQANAGTHFADCNIGLSFGNALIVKRKKDGKWVVLVTSGYNNVSPGDGIGYLYVVDAQTGAILNRLSTGVGCNAAAPSPCGGTDDPSGLSRINAWVDNATQDNTALRVYGGDLKGNLWRFQLDPGGIGGENAVHKIVTLVNDGGVAQPITTKPELGVVQNYPVVFLATGKLLGPSDKDLIPTPQTQTIYAVRDDLSNTAIDLRTDLVEQELSLISGSSVTRTTTSNAVDFDVNKGWFVDLPDVGERANVDPQLQLGTLVVPTNVPDDSDCTAGGFGWLNFLDYRTGGYIPVGTSTVASMKVTSALVVGINVIQLPGGTIKTIVTTADNQQISQSTPVSSAAVTGRRVTWRELLVE